MRIGFPWAMRCPVCIFWAGTRLAVPQRRNQTQGPPVLFKSQRNRFELVDCLHIPLAMWAMFQSKRKLTEEMLSEGALSCFHAIHVLQLSRSLNLSYLSSPSSLSLLYRRILTFTSIIWCVLSPRWKSSMNLPINILANIQVNRQCYIRNQCWVVSSLTGVKEVSMSRDLRAVQEFLNKGRQMPPSPYCSLVPLSLKPPGITNSAIRAITKQ